MKIIVPIRPCKGDLDFPDYKRFKKDILKLNSNKDLVNLLNFGDDISDISFYLTTKQKIKKENIYYNYFNDNELEIIEKDILIIELLTNYREKKPNGTIQFISDHIGSSFLYILSILFNISYEFSLDFLKGIILGKNNQLLGKTKIVFNYFEYAYESKYKLHWPLVDSIDIITTLNWLSKNEIFIVDKSSCKAGRAINALTQTVGEPFEPTSTHLFWVMLGIETLLAEGNNNITNQIRTKCIILFGEPKEFKKKLNKLYDYRSRFVHGDIDIPSKLFYEEDEEFNFEYRSQLNFGISILISLIRKLIRDNKTEFKFEYRYIDANS